MHTNILIGLLRPVLSLSGDTKIVPLRSGDVNQVFHLTDQERHYAVKVIGDDSFTGVDRMQQYSLQEQLAARSLAPMPVWLSDDLRVWVEEWIVPCANHVSDTMEASAKALAHIHQLPMTAKRLGLSERWQYYLDQAALPLDHSLREKVVGLSSTVRKLENIEDDLCLCHNDLSAGHILSSDPLVLIDWEYAAMGNRYFDLAACASINALSADDCQKLCEAYSRYSKQNLSEVNTKFAQFFEIVEVTNALWQAALDQSRTSLEQGSANL